MIKIYLNKFISAALLSVLTAVFFSCVREADDSDAAEKPSEAVSSGSNEKTAERKGRKDTVSQNSSVITDTEGMDFLLYYERKTDAVYPEDFIIGSLQPAETVTAGEAAILETARRFLDSVVIGTPDYSLIAGEKSDFVIGNISAALEKTSPYSYRIGVINNIKDPAWAEVRLQGPDIDLKGTMYFIKNGNWKIYDFHPEAAADDEFGDDENGNWIPGLKSN